MNARAQARLERRVAEEAARAGDGRPLPERDAVERNVRRAAMLDLEAGRIGGAQLAHHPAVGDLAAPHAPIDLPVGDARLGARRELALQLLAQPFFRELVPPVLPEGLTGDPQARAAPTAGADARVQRAQARGRRAGEGREPPRVEHAGGESADVLSGGAAERHVPAVVQDKVQIPAHGRILRMRPAVLAEEHRLRQVVPHAGKPLVARHRQHPALHVRVDEARLRRPRTPVVRRRGRGAAVRTQPRAPAQRGKATETGASAQKRPPGRPAVLSLYHHRLSSMCRLMLSRRIRFFMPRSLTRFPGRPRWIHTAPANQAARRPRRTARTRRPASRDTSPAPRAPSSSPRRRCRPRAP